MLFEYIIEFIPELHISTLKIETVCTSETLGSTHKVALCQNSEDHHLNNYCHDLKSCSCWCVIISLNIQLLTFWALLSCFLFETQCFGYWILSPSSGKSLLIWVQSIELVPISGDRDLMTDRIHSPKLCVLNKKQDNG
jgi:hypothetical protein